jgi:ribosomal RNA-processing protein 12
MEESSPSTLELAFTKIRTQTTSGVAAVRRPATLLTAIDSTLAKQDGSAIPPSAYLVALVSTLTQLTTSTPAAAKPSGDKRELLEATLYLLSLLAPHLDQPLLRAKMSLLSTLQPLYPSFQSTAPPLKSLIAISQPILAALSPQQLEKDLPARTVYASILSLCGDARPKVRRRAQEAVGALLSAPPPPAVSHPYAEETAGWILERLEDAVKGAKRGGKKDAAPTPAPGAKGGKGAEKAKEAAKAVGGQQEEAGGSDESRAIALLTFIKNLGTAWDDKVGHRPLSSPFGVSLTSLWRSQQATPALLPTLLSTLTLSSPHLTLAALTLLSHLFSAARAADSLSANSVQETLEALIDAKPKGAEGEGGEKLMAGWVEGVGEGMVAFARWVLSQFGRA